MLVTLVGTTTEKIRVLKNAESEIVTRLVGREMLVTLTLFANADAPMLLTGIPEIVSGITTEPPEPL